MANQMMHSSSKNKTVAAILCAFGFFGIGGLQHFYVGRVGKGLLYFFTAGLFVFGTIIDLISILTNHFYDNNGLPLRDAKPSNALQYEQMPFVPPVISGYALRYNYNNVEVAGSEFFDSDFVHIGDVVELVPEPYNEHDPRAVAVKVRGQKIGYIHRNRLQDMYHDFCEQSGLVYAQIVALRRDNILMGMGYYALADEPLAAAKK